MRFLLDEGEYADFNDVINVRVNFNHFHLLFQPNQIVNLKA